MPDAATASKQIPAWRRGVAELALLVALSLLMGALGPYGTSLVPAGPRYLYWGLCIMGGGAIGIALDSWLAARGFGSRLALSSLLMTPAVTAYVIALARLFYARWIFLPAWGELLWQVLVISVAVMACRALAWRRPQIVVASAEPPASAEVASPAPEPESAFRRRLSAKRRLARLIAVEAHDHYLRVHTDAGMELVALRFADALAELAGFAGFRIHRSWWVAADAIEAVRWRRGGGEAQLAGGLTVPVSRSHAPALKAAGWF